VKLCRIGIMLYENGSNGLIGARRSARVHHAPMPESPMSSIDDVARFIYSRRQQLDAQLRSDLVRLQCEFGDRLLSEAVALADKLAERDRLSVSGAKQRQREQRADKMQAQALFARKSQS
jgi:hypothetical protein